MRSLAAFLIDNRSDLRTIEDGICLSAENGGKQVQKVLSGLGRSALAAVTMAAITLTLGDPRAAHAKPVQQMSSAITTVDADASKKQSTSFEVSGKIVGDNGESVANVPIQVGLMELQPQVAGWRDNIPFLQLGVTPLSRTLTNAEGEFVLSLPALKGISRYLDERGNARLHFTSLSRKYQLFYSLPVKLPDTPGTLAMASVEDPRIQSERAISEGRKKNGERFSWPVIPYRIPALRRPTLLFLPLHSTWTTPKKDSHPQDL